MMRNSAVPALPPDRPDWTIGPAKHAAAFVLLAMIAAAIVVGWQRIPVSTPRAPGELTAALRVNINTATREELELLPGVGSALAQRIIDSRMRQGKFRSLADLERVSGIGTSVLNQIKTVIRYD